MQGKTKKNVFDDSSAFQTEAVLLLISYIHNHNFGCQIKPFLDSYEPRDYILSEMVDGNLNSTLVCKSKKRKKCVLREDLIILQQEQIEAQ